MDKTNTAQQITDARSKAMAFRLARGETIANYVRAKIAVTEYEGRLLDSSAIY